MKNRLKYFCLFLVCCPFLKVSAQRKEISLGDTYFEYFQFPQAIQQYELALSKNPTTGLAYIYRQLAKSYEYSFKYVDAESCYLKAIQNKDKENPEDYLGYGIMLKANGKYEAAKVQFDAYSLLTAENAAARLQVRSINWAIKNKDAVKPVTITLTNLDISGQALGLCRFENGMLYAQARNKKSDAGMPVFDLDFSEMKDTVSFVPGNPVVNKIDFKANEGAPSVSKDGGLLYFNANASSLKKGNNKKTGGIEISDDGVSNFKIYVCENRNGEFVNVQELSFNGKEYNCIHPSISEDGEILYFASDMPGGSGGLDLYMVKRNDRGAWDKPINLGSGVNTPENELFPFVHRDRIYFASKGFNGYGGYDLYTAKLSLSGMPSSPQNMGMPINSYRDDNAMMVYDDGRFGYFSSNRDNDTGADKVYFFHDHTLDPALPSAIVSAAPSAVTKKADTLATKTVSDTSQAIASNPHNPLVPDVKPEVKPIPEKLSAKGATVKSLKEPLSVRKEEDSQEDKVTRKSDAKMNVSDDWLSSKRFKHVRFQLNDFYPQGNYEETLDSVIQLVKESNTIKIQINAYADSRGSEEYNLRLSVNRALAVKKLFRSRGIASNRIITAGFGESVLLNGCSDGVACSEEEHAINRRVEIRLTR